MAARLAAAAAMPVTRIIMMMMAPATGTGRRPRPGPPDGRAGLRVVPVAAQRLLLVTMGTANTKVTKTKTALTGKQETYTVAI